MTTSVVETLRRLSLPNLDVQGIWIDDVRGFVPSRKGDIDAIEDISTHPSNHMDANYRDKCSVITDQIESVASRVLLSASLFNSLDDRGRIEQKTHASPENVGGIDISVRNRYHYTELADDMDFVSSLSTTFTTIHAPRISHGHKYGVLYQRLSPSRELYVNERKASEEPRRRYRHQLRMVG
ncbi:hypothetical protein Y032_0154g2952 [Ancylostoma ceylanicum]|uniref:Uncharacterized protein n=1 Tax=Ancylostoma ceylanicum TaxID=53326 RepID=A0A016SZX6_9BILA|nr:hypothetical protein Y032_0154g2952 [Ancylostoma ceylanicum]